MLAGCSFSNDTTSFDEIATNDSENLASQNNFQEPSQADFSLANTPQASHYDLTMMSETMVFAQVFSLMSSPESFQDSTYKIQGEYEFYTIPETTEVIYFIVINDALGCCPTGIEIRFPENSEPLPDFCEILIEGIAHAGFEETFTYPYIEITSLVII